MEIFLHWVKEKFIEEVEKGEMRKLETLKRVLQFMKIGFVQTWIRRRTKSIVRMNAGTGEKEAWKILIKYFKPTYNIVDIETWRAE